MAYRNRGRGGNAKPKTKDENKNYVVSEDDWESPTISLRPSPVRTRKRVQFPPLQDIDKNTAPPGLTPVTSGTNLVPSQECQPQLDVPPRRIIHPFDSTTSMEVEVDPDEEDISSLESTCTVATSFTRDALKAAPSLSTSSYLRSPSYTSKGSRTSYTTPSSLSTPKRGHSVPSKLMARTEPWSSSEPWTVTTDIDTPPELASKTVVSSTPATAGALPGKSILRKPTVTSAEATIKSDLNSNYAPPLIIPSSSVESKSSEGLPQPQQSSNLEENSGDAANNNDDGFTQHEIWERENASKTMASLTPRLKISREKPPRSRSTLSCNSGRSYYSQYALSKKNSRNRKSISSDFLPPMMSHSRGGRSVQKQLPNLTSVITELRQKEVVFDRAAAIDALKGRILRGEKVTYEEIQAIRKMTLPPHHRHLGYRMPWSTDLYCHKGLVHIPV